MQTAADEAPAIAGAPPAISKRAILQWMLFFMVAGLYIRMQPPFYFFTYNNDEYILMGIVNARSFSQLMHFALYDSHPPLYYILAHYWSLISDSPPFVRSLELMMGMAAIPIYYAIGKRIDGPLMGLCCAGLVTFSFGAIVQSYIMRQYCLLVLTLSANFYYYILWRMEHKKSALAGYVITGWLVALSHFFSDFYYLSLMVFETCWLYRSREALGMRKLIEWLGANAAVFVLVAVLYYFWEPTLSFYKHASPRAPISAEQLVVATLASPFYAASYIYPAPYPLLPFLLLYVPIALGREMRATLRPYLILGIIACVISMMVYAFDVFQWLGTRHCLWMFPLLIVPAGGVLADIIRRRRAATGRFPVKAALMLILIAAVADTGKRFMDEDYPNWAQGTLQSMKQVVDRLGPRDVLITDKDGLNLLANMSPYKTSEEFMNSDMPVIAPYKNTNILIGQRYFGYYSPKAVRDMLLRAEEGHLLDNIDRIVIVKLWNKWPFAPLVTCYGLRQRLLFPTDRRDVYNMFATDFLVTAIPKQQLFDQVLMTGAPLQQCLDPDQDTIPEWYYLPRTARHEPY